MRLIRAKNYDDMSLKAANIIAAQVSLNPKSVLGLATGSTPIGTYRHLVEWYQKGELDFGKAVSINLDEYCGLSGDHPQSYRRFMRENLFDHINIPADRSFLPDGTQTDSASTALPSALHRPPFPACRPGTTACRDPHDSASLPEMRLPPAAA